jgi:ATP-dependent exoDNAse (exonuclease V) beta subunit
MTGPVLKKDTLIQFPHITVLKASAGSGKTHTLTKRFVQFILSERVGRNGLRNILAITFSNNAAREMKERVLSWLKSVYFDDPERMEELAQITSLDRESMREKAGLLVDEILDHYADFQVRTIDSFMTTVFKSSAIDFGYNPDFEILLNNSALMDYAFNIFLRNVREGSDEAFRIEEIIDFLLDYKKTDASYLWDPSSALLDEIKKIYGKLSSTGKRPKIEDHSRQLETVKKTITEVIAAIEEEIEESGLKRHGGSSYKTICPLVKEKSFPDLIGKSFANPPVTKLTKGQAGQQAAYERITGLWAEVSALVARYSVLYARSRCMPYLRAYEAFSRTVETAKRQQGKIFIEDINRHLAEYLNSAIVPDIYFRIGETVYHFLIDEFQDTSPIQWRNLFPLIENSLSQGGSLFAVGDTKQAIYGFRNADYTIMKSLEEDNPFPSAEHDVRELDINYRSLKKILEYNEKIFKEKVPGNDDYREAGERSGLTEYDQKVRQGSKNEGYAEVQFCERNDSDPSEKAVVQGLIRELLERGYQCGDIAVLTQKNEEAVRATTWLNENNVPFISYSSLDVRRRKITGEVVALLNFLDSPTDDFSFGTFILGEIFSAMLEKECKDTDIGQIREFWFEQRKSPPLYKAFQKEFEEIWKKYFEGLFRSSGFFPLYDLVTEIFAVFRVFETMVDEEATLVKILEVVKDFEGVGFNSLRDFLETAADDEGGDSEWEMDVPKNINAVKVMTVHKSKGLEFPVVIMLLYESRNRGFDYIVEEGEDGVSLLKINQAIAACDPSFQALYDAERMKEQVNRLNSLYVGFTRPKSELYVIGVRKSEKGYPFDLLPASEYQSSPKPESSPDVVLPGMLPAISPLHQNRLVGVPEGPGQFISVEERRRGEFMHAVLFFIDYINEDLEAELTEIIRRVRERTATDYPEDAARKNIMGLLFNREIIEYFIQRADREIRKEQEFSDETGRLYRMDRVVIDKDKVTVIDFKTGRDTSAEEKQRAQINTYMKILGEVYPGRTIGGVIAYIDLGEVRRLP